MNHVFLSHLSKENNNPDLVYDLFKAHAEGVEIVLTSRMAEIPVYEITTSGGRKVSPDSINSLSLNFNISEKDC
jgi:hypothetical protein